jgi:hypothetical protein
MDRYYVEAFGIGSTDKEDKIYALLKKTMGSKKYQPRYSGLVWRLHPVQAIPEIKKWALDKTLNPKVQRSMLFALSLIEAPQAAKAMIEIAKNGESETSSLAKAFIEKRDQGIWNQYQTMDLLNGKKIIKTEYVDRMAPTSFGPEKDLPHADQILALKGNQKTGKMR